MATFLTLSPAQVQAKASLNQLLMYGNTSTDTGGIKFNLDALKELVDAAGGGGGGGGAESSGAIGEIILGGETDEAIYWKRRFSPLEHMLNADSKNPTGFDPEGKSLKNELLQFIQSNDAGLTLGIDSTNYLGQYLVIAKSSSIAFKVKKGVNFFSVGSFISVGSNNMEVRIDGQTPSSLGLTDENGNASPDFYSEVSATNFAQSTTFFYGLDGEEHLITLTNNDSGSEISRTNFVEVGYRSENPTINEEVKISAGKASVRGTEVTFAEGVATFGNINKNGHTGSIVADTAGVLTALDGESPAMTQCKPEEDVIFSGAVTNLKVKNNFYFPDNGICLLSTPYGNHHLFSFTDKIATLIQAHQLDGILWQSKPTENFNPVDGFTSTSTGGATGDLNINYFGTAPILIDSTNNRIDFAVTIAGVRTVHAATIAAGRYSADLVPIETAIRAAMQSAKSIGGEYHAKYSTETQLWTLYTKGEEVESLELLFSSGANFANSVHLTLGFATADLSGSKSYLGSTAVQHLCCRVLEAEKVFMHSEDPRIKYSAVHTSITDADILDLEERLGLGSIRNMDTVGLIQIFPDSDCSGLAVSFANHIDGSMTSFQIDDGQTLYLAQRDTTISASSIRGRVVTSFISFPRGSKKISIRNESAVPFKIGATSNQMYFVGCQQYFTKPAYEKLTLAQSIIKTFDISPVSLYATPYGHNGGTLYSPGGSDDNINTITEGGSWGGTADGSVFNGALRFGSSSNAYVEVDFTLVGDGGGIFMKTKLGSAWTHKAAVFLSTTAINESTDRLQNTKYEWTGTFYPDQNASGILGLPAGTYKVRFKNEDIGAQSFYNLGFVVVDTIPPQENANTVTDVSNTGQGISYPVNVVKEVIQQDSADRVPAWLERSGYKEGKVSKVNYAVNTPAWDNDDDETSIIRLADRYYGSRYTEGAVGAVFSISGFFKSITVQNATFTDENTAITPFIDGVQTLNNFSCRVQVKGGTSPSSVRRSTSRLTSKVFSLSCTHNTGLVFNISDTRGIKNNMTVILSDGVNKEKAVIDSFVVGVSYTIKKALALVVAANVTSIGYQGFHNYLMENSSSGFMYQSAFEYEPLKVSPSKALQRRATDFEYEKVSIDFPTVSNGDDLYYPVHSDGVVGNWTTSTITVIGMGADTAYDFPQDLKNIPLVGSTMHVVITSERLVPVLAEQERF